MWNDCIAFPGGAGGSTQQCSVQVAVVPHLSSSIKCAVMVFCYLCGSWNVLQVNRLLSQHSLVVFLKKAMLCTSRAVCILQCEGKIITASPENQVLKLRISKRPPL